MKNEHGMTPRMYTAFDCIQAAGRAGITRAEIGAKLGLKYDNLRDIMQALRLLGKIRSTGGKWSKWYVAEDFQDEPEDVVDLPNPRQILRPVGTWQAIVKQPQSWHP